MGTELCSRYAVDTDIRFLVVAKQIVFYRVVGNEYVEVPLFFVGGQDIMALLFEIKYVHAKRAEERTLRVFSMPLRRPCGGVQRESRRHGTVRWARRQPRPNVGTPFL